MRDDDGDRTAGAQAEYGPLRVISYPTAPFGLVTKRLNDFRRNLSTLPCPAT